MEIFASSNRRSTLTVFMALAPNLHEPSWTTRSLFKKNSSNTEIASSSLAPHTRQYMQRKDLFMPSAAPASVYASSVILLAPPANLPSRPPSSTSSSSPSSSTSSPSSRSSPTSSPKRRRYHLFRPNFTAMLLPLLQLLCILAVSAATTSALAFLHAIPHPYIYTYI
ncbi:hypothetical protein ACFXTN_005990 [Malus domestica]